MSRITTDSQKQAFAQCLSKLMERRGITGQQISDYVGVNPSNISHYLSARHYPSAHIRQRMAKLLRIPAEMLEPDAVLRLMCPWSQAEALGRIIRRILEANDMSQTEFARVSGLNAFSANYYFHGKQFPRDENLSRVAEGLNLTVNGLAKLIADEMRAGAEMALNALSASDATPVSDEIAPLRNEQVIDLNTLTALADASPVSAETAEDTIEVTLCTVGNRTKFTLSGELDQMDVFALVSTITGSGRSVKLKPVIV